MIDYFFVCRDGIACCRSRGEFIGKENCLVGKKNLLMRNREEIEDEVGDFMREKNEERLWQRVGESGAAKLAADEEGSSS